MLGQCVESLIADSVHNWCQKRSEDPISKIESSVFQVYLTHMAQAVSKCIPSNRLEIAGMLHSKSPCS